MSRLSALIAMPVLAALPFIATATADDAMKSSVAETCAVSSQFSRIMNVTREGATIETLPGKQYQVSFSSPCLGTDGFTVAFAPKAQASVCIERGDAFQFNSQGIRYVCRIQTIEPVAKKATP